MEYQRVIILNDDSGHDYVVPFELSEEFSRLLDLGEEGEDEFIDKFDEYMCGGDPFGEYEFYIKGSL